MDHLGSYFAIVLVIAALVMGSLAVQPLKESASNHAENLESQMIALAQTGTSR